MKQKLKRCFKKIRIGSGSDWWEVTDDGAYRLYHQGKEVANLPVDALAEDAPTYHKEKAEPARIQAFSQQPDFEPVIDDATAVFYNCCSNPRLLQKIDFETYDSQVRTNTVVGPGSDAAVLRIKGTNKALAMTTDCNARYLYLDPERGGQIAVAEAARNIVSFWGRPLAITDCLNYGSPDKPEGFWELWTSAEGIAKACEILETLLFQVMFRCTMKPTGRQSIQHQ